MGEVGVGVAGQERSVAGFEIMGEVGELATTSNTLSGLAGEDYGRGYGWVAVTGGRRGVAGFEIMVG